MSENKKKLSITFRMLRKLGFNYSEEAMVKCLSGELSNECLKPTKTHF